MIPLFRGKGFLYTVIALFTLIIVGGALYWFMYQQPDAPVVTQDAGATPTCTDAILASDSQTLPVTCKFAIAPNKEATLHITDRGVEVSDETGILFNSQDADYAFPETFETGNFFGGDSTHMTPDIVRITDVTWDGYADLLLQTNRGASNLVYTGIAFDPSAHAYADTVLFEIMNPEINQAAQRIVSTAYAGNGAGIEMTYVFNRTTYDAVEKIENEFIDGVLMRISYVRENGAWVETNREIAQ